MDPLSGDPTLPREPEDMDDDDDDESEFSSDEDDNCSLTASKVPHTQNSGIFIINLN